MYQAFGSPVGYAIPSAPNLFLLSLYIGQFKAPLMTVSNGNAALAMKVRTGAQATKDVYPLLATDGTSGTAQDTNGVTVGSATNGGTTGASQSGNSTSMLYNVTYQSTAGYVGTDSFDFSITNPVGTATRTLAVTVVGIDSAGTVTGYKGQTYSGGSPLYTITSSTGTLTGFTTNPTGLPSPLSVDSSGRIVGTPSAAGQYTVTLQANTSGTLNDGAVTKSLALTIAGISSASTLNLTQSSGTGLPFQVTAVPTGGAPYSISGSVPGLSFSTSTGQLSGTPTITGTYPITVSATTSAGVVSQSMSVVVASAGVPVISSTPTLNAAPTTTLVGTVGTAITPIQVSASNPPINSGSYAASGLPTGLAIDVNSGQITGTPSDSGDFAVTLSAANVSGTGTRNVVMRVNAINAPVIGSAGTATGTVGTNATVYTISASSNGPITGYSVQSGTLPAGLALNTSTGAISGTPTASGITTVTLAATNTVALTGSRSVTFTILPNTVPTITSPAANSTTSVSVGSVSIPIAATNPPFTAFSVSSGTLPSGLSISVASDGLSGLISGTVSAPAAATAISIRATNVVGNSSPITFNLGVAVPNPTACALSAPLNTASSLDLANCMFPGLTPTGMSITSAPGHGAAALSGSTVTYTPAKDFFGTDTFMARAFFGSSSSVAGTVTVTVTGRPDPAKDVTVTGLVANQTQTALRFSQAQVSNFGRHMESLRRPGGLSGLRSSLSGLTPAGVQVLNSPGSDGAWNTSSQSSSTFGNAALTNAAASQAPPSNAWPPPAGSATQLPGGTNPTASLPVDSGVLMAMTQMGVPNAPLIGLLYNFNQNHSLDLGALKTAFGGEGQSGSALPGTSVWVEGVVSFGSRDANGGTDAAQFSSNGISVGVDMPVSEAFTWGMGLGLARDVAYIGTGGSRNQSQGYSLAAYGSYLFGENAFVEGMLGVGTIDYDMRRWVDPAADFALSNRKGYQIFGSVGTGLEFRTNGRMISPYARLDFSQDKLAEVTETGAGNYALHYFDQTNDSSQAVLGLRGEAVHSTSFGWAVPRARVEWRQDLMDDSASVISYADQIGGTRYSIAPSGGRRSALVLGLGSEFLFRDGWSFGLDYQLSRVSDSESSYALRVRLTKELGAKGLRRLLKDDEEITDDENAITLDSSATWDDNVTRAKLDSDIRADMVYTVNVSRTWEYQLTGNTRLLLMGVATGERFQNFNGLSRVALGAEANLQYRGSAAFDAPTWGLVGKVSGEDFVSTLRDGTRTALGVTWLQPLTDRITLFSALMANARQSNDTVFDTQDTSLRMNLDYALGKGATLYLTGEYRDGDIVSTGRRSLENITISQARVQDDAFPDGVFSSYRFKGTTTLVTLGYNLGLGARDSVDFSWRFVQSTPSLRPAWVTSPSSYISNQLSATYLMRF
jgi:outer membrane autotransporter protein